MRLIVAILVVGVGALAAEPVLTTTGMRLVTYVLLVLATAAAASLAIRSWPRRHPDLCPHCRGRGTTTFVAARRLRTRHCFVCKGTGRT
ncbi:hypothetical protein [Cryptosporangium minutisporangium]|uniref:Uncharacterized protein n=1 Tax=Cryptosporangium minutisporangium TaxID=113569 RepID=A0ABP6T8A9_9ACTN